MFSSTFHAVSSLCPVWGIFLGFTANLQGETRHGVTVFLSSVSGFRMFRDAPLAAFS